MNNDNDNNWHLLSAHFWLSFCSKCFTSITYFNSHNFKERTQLTLLKGVGQPSMIGKGASQKAMLAVLNTTQEREHSSQETQVQGFPWQDCAFCGLWAGVREQGDSSASPCTNSMFLSILPYVGGLPMLVCLLGEKVLAMPRWGFCLIGRFSLHISKVAFWLIAQSALLGWWRETCVVEPMKSDLEWEPEVGLRYCVCFLLLL